ncbi:MAG: HNH endonuclease [Phycisphaerales bacterium JB043]
MDRCIYCQREFDPSKGEGEHVIPARFGQFHNALKLRRICTSCNSHIGKLQEHLFRSTIESTYLQIVSPLISRRHRGTSRRRSKGAKPPQYIADYNGLKHIVEFVGREDLFVDGIDQVIAVDKYGRQEFIELFPTLSAKHIPRICDRLGLVRPIEMTFLVNESLRDHYQAIVDQLFPEQGIKLSRHICPGAKSKGSISHWYSKESLRAIIAIGFHHFLCANRRGLTGHEPMFNSIKELIYTGHGTNPFMRLGECPVKLPYGPVGRQKGITGEHWEHLLVSGETNECYFSYLRLFLGPGNLPPSYYFKIADLEEQHVYIPERAQAHSYKYPLQDRDKMPGQVVTENLVEFKYASTLGLVAPNTSTQQWFS